MKNQRHAGAKNLPVRSKRTLWCLPCAMENRAVPASTVVDDDPTCAGCALAASIRTQAVFKESVAEAAAEDTRKEAA